MKRILVGILVMVLVVALALPATTVIAEVTSTGTDGPAIPSGRVLIYDNHPDNPENYATPVIVTALTGVDLSLDQYENSDEVRVFNEKQGYTLASALAIDEGFGIFSGEASIPVNYVINSHLIHQEPEQENSKDAMRSVGSIEFDGDIIAVIVEDELLDDSDDLGNDDIVAYPTGLNLRGLETYTAAPWQDLYEVSGNVIKIDLQSAEVMDQIRVLTEPAEEECWETVWQIGDVEPIDPETGKPTKYYDEFNYQGPVGHFYPDYTDPFVAETTLDSEFPWISNYSRGYATDFRVQWDGELRFGGELTVSWSPGLSGQETVIITSVDGGETETFVVSGSTDPNGWQGYPLVESTLALDPLEKGGHEFRFQNTSGNGLLWDWVRLDKPCEVILPLDHFLGYKVKTTKVCDGGVTELTLLNNGPAAEITVTTKDRVVFGPEEVDEDAPFSFGEEGVKLGTSINIFVNGVLQTTIHTSCSQPIYPGQTFGAFTVVEGESLKGGPLETPAPKFDPKEVTLTDQFATGLFKVEKPDKLYNPADKEIVPDEADFADVADVETHLISYKVKLVEYLETPTCAPCKGGLTSLTLQYNGSSDAYVAVTGGSVPFEKTLNEGEEFTIVGGGKDGKLDKDVTITVGGVLDATIHTSCSQPIGTGQTFGDFTVVAGESKDGGSLCPIITVESQFGTIVVARDKPDRLLVPTAKSLTGPVEPLDETGVDHFLGYKIKAPKDMEVVQVTVVDQFGQPKVYDVKKPTRLFVPVDKDGEVIKNPEAHLICYTIKPAKDQPKHENVLGIHTNNQFGPLKLNTDKEVELLVPCQKILP